MEAIASRQRHYCVVCSNYRGKVVEERVLQLHRFPADDRLRRAWIRRIKLIKPNYKWNESQRLCSEHFTYGKKKGNEIPSVFASKTFEKNQVIILPRLFIGLYCWSEILPLLLLMYVYVKIRLGSLQKSHRGQILRVEV